MDNDSSLRVALRRRRNDFPAGTPDSKILAALIAKGDEALEQRRQRESDRFARMGSTCQHVRDGRRRSPQDGVVDLWWT